MKLGKSKIGILAALFIAAVSEISFAGQILTTTIDNVRVRQHVAYIKFADCARYSVLYLDSEYAKAIYSTALVAGASGSSVKVDLDTANCSVDESTIIYLDLGF